MKRTLIAFAIAGIGFSAPALAGPLEEQFFAMDTSRDGSISRAEYVAFQVSEGATERQANFAFDNTRGSDSKVSLNEYRAGPVSRVQRNSTANRTSSKPRQRTARTPSRNTGGSFRGRGS